MTAAVTDALASIDDYVALYPVESKQRQELGRQLLAVSRYIEFRTGQFFTLDATATVRIFIPDRESTSLWLDTNLGVAPTSVKFDTNADGTYATTLASTDYELWPLNAADGPEPQPWRRIDLVPWGDYSSFTAGQRVQVTAQWGYPAVPEAIRQACIQLTSILRIESPRATSTINEMGLVVGMSSQSRGIIEELLSAYPRLPI